jgi:hypothetical protein
MSRPYAQSIKGTIYPYPRREGGSPTDFDSAGGFSSAPFLSSDGKRLFLRGDYRGGEGLIYRDLEWMPGERVRVGPAVGLFAMTASTYPLANIGAVARDGKHLILVSTDDRNPFKIQMLTDWTTLLSSAGKDGDAGERHWPCTATWQSLFDSSPNARKRAMRARSSARLAQHLDCDIAMELRVGGAIRYTTPGLPSPSLELMR